MKDGMIFTALHQHNSHFAVAILAVIEQGKLRAARRRDTCGLRPGSRVEIFSMHNEAGLKVRVGGTDSHLEGHCHSSTDAKHLPERNMVGTAGFVPRGPVKRHVMTAAARARINGMARRDLARLLTAQKERRAFNYTFIDHALEQGGQRFYVVEAKLKPKAKCAGEHCWLAAFCGPGSHGNSGVLIYRARRGAKPELVFHRVETPRSADAFKGELSLVGFLPLQRSGWPWLILLSNGCEAWDFDLLEPVEGTWKTRITGAAGTTV